MTYVTYDETGALTGFYIQDLHPEHASNYIELTAPLARGWPEYRANAARDGLEEVAPQQAEP